MTAGKPGATLHLRTCGGAILLLAILASCSSGPVLNPEKALEAGAVPCAARLTLLVTWPSQGKAERFEVHRGIFGWSGGAAALAATSTWKCDLSAENCERITKAAEALCAARPEAAKCTGQQDQFDLELWCGDSSFRVIAPWPDAALGELPAILEEVARTRLVPALDKLPTAGGRL